jgi:hypothetical protein
VVTTKRTKTTTPKPAVPPRSAALPTQRGRAVVTTKRTKTTTPKAALHPRSDALSTDSMGGTKENTRSTYAFDGDKVPILSGAGGPSSFTVSKLRKVDKSQPCVEVGQMGIVNTRGSNAVKKYVVIQLVVARGIGNHSDAWASFLAFVLHTGDDGSTWNEDLLQIDAGWLLGEGTPLVKLQWSKASEKDMRRGKKLWATLLANTYVMKKSVWTGRYVHSMTHKHTHTRTRACTHAHCTHRHTHTSHFTRRKQFLALAHTLRAYRPRIARAHDQQHGPSAAPQAGGAMVLSTNTLRGTPEPSGPESPAPMISNMDPLHGTTSSNMAELSTNHLSLLDDTDSEYKNQLARAPDNIQWTTALSSVRLQQELNLTKAADQQRRADQEASADKMEKMRAQHATQTEQMRTEQRTRDHGLIDQLLARESPTPTERKEPRMGGAYHAPPPAVPDADSTHDDDNDLLKVIDKKLRFYASEKPFMAAFGLKQLQAMCGDDEGNKSMLAEMQEDVRKGAMSVDDVRDLMMVNMTQRLATHTHPHTHAMRART